MKVDRHDLLTFPNFITLGRLFATPFVAYGVYRQPERWWWLVALFAATDLFDGYLSRLEKHGPRWAQLGLRTSRFGSLADPVADKFFAITIFLAGWAAGLIPLLVVLTALSQKLSVAVVVGHAYRRGLVVRVSPMGKVGELVTQVGLVVVIAAASLESPTSRLLARYGGSLVTLLGIGVAWVALSGYLRVIRSRYPLTGNHKGGQSD